ncbi:MAG: long-chain-acyl-CoA synthetase [Sandaracinaceae bacterium]|nr:long-chain-acyl-CoA synthetase [Sandaracinaceae bacterium]
MLSGLRDGLAREARFLDHFSRLILRIRKAKEGKEHTVVDTIEGWADARPHHPALIDGARKRTYREMDAYANRVARWARDEGVQRGDAVALLMTNRLEYVCAWLGVLKAGGVCALVNGHLHGPGLAHTVRISGARHVIVGAELLETWGSCTDGLEEPPIVWVQRPPGDATELPAGARSLDDALAKKSEVRLPPSARRGLTAEQSAFYIYTSGTTGLPKAANITHIRAANIMHAFAVMLGADETDRIYDPLPLYHATGGIGGVGAALTVGASVVLRDRFSASHFWSDVAEHDCTMFLYVGELCRYLVNSPPHPDERRHRIRACMGNGLRPEVWPAFRDRFGLPHIVEFYGSSEGNVSLFNLDDVVGAVGRLPAIADLVLKVRIVAFDVEREEVVRDAKGRVIECAPGEVGEAIGLIDATKAGGRFDGYRDPEATRKKILTDAFAVGDRWFRTGDLMKRDADGYFYFVDRIGDTFRWKGENVATSEVAEVLGVFDGVEEANVYGVSVEGHDGRAGMATVVAAEDLDLAALHAHVAASLPAYAQPLFLRRCDEMVTTGTFKHRKVDLVREGFDPSTIAEPLFVRDDAAGTYVPLTPEVHAAILSGAHRV